MNTRLWINQLVGNLKTSLKRYASFRGSATHVEFWSWILFLALLGILLLAIVACIGLIRPVLFTAYALAALLFLPTLSVAVRRLHDTGHSGWWIITWLFVAFGTVLFGLLSGYLLEGMSPGYDEVSTLARILMPILTLTTLAISVIILLWLAAPKETGETA